jgi:hypothetical protein
LVVCIRPLLNILRARSCSTETIGAVFVRRAGFLVVSRVLLRFGMLDRLFSVRLFHRFAPVVSNGNDQVAGWLTPAMPEAGDADR